MSIGSFRPISTFYLSSNTHANFALNDGYPLPLRELTTEEMRLGVRLNGAAATSNVGDSHCERGQC